MIGNTLALLFFIAFLGACQSVKQYSPEGISLNESETQEVSQQKQVKLYNSFKLGMAYKAHKQDYKAVHYYGSCAKQGDVEAMYQLSQLYKKKKETQNLYLKWLKQAAKFEHIHALNLQPTKNP